MHRTSCFHRNLLCLATLALSACTALAPQPTPTASFTNTPPPTATYTPSPTATNTATLTPTATPTFTPTFTLTPTFTSTSSPTPQLACNVKAGQWSSHETASGFPASLLTFQVYACMVISFDVWDFVIPGELYVLEEGAKTLIENQHFLYKKSEGNGQVIIEGSFDSPNSANGTITYTKGFFYIDFSLSRDAIKKWTASPSP